MLELMLCSIADAASGFSVPPLRAGQAPRQGNHVILGLVRASLGHHALPDTHSATDHRGTLQSPLLERRQCAVSDHVDLRRNRRSGIGGLCRLQPEGEEGRSRCSRSTARDRKPRSRLRSAHVVEVEANMGTAKADVLTSQGKLDEAKGDYQQALDEYNTKKKLYERNPDVVATRETREAANAGVGTARQRRRCECQPNSRQRRAFR